MASVSVYLNFAGKTEEAFEFYKTVFGTEYVSPIQRYSDIPAGPDMTPVPDEQQDWVLHVALPLIGDFVLMGSDAPSTVKRVKMGNNCFINLSPDTREETERLFNALSREGEVTMPLADMFWGDYFGSLVDRFGVHWMVNCPAR